MLIVLSKNAWIAPETKQSRNLRKQQGIKETVKKTLTMDDFYFTVGKDPCEVFVVIGDQWIPYKRCETEEIAQALVIGQNNNRRGGESYQVGKV